MGKVAPKAQKTLSVVHDISRQNVCPRRCQYASPPRPLLLQARRSQTVMWTRRLLLALTLLAVVHLPGATAQQALCPFTKAPPTKPAVPFSRCLDANGESCCAACTDIRFAIMLRTLKLS